MARARNIKPGFYKNEQLAACSVWARYIFPGLWMLADREGRLEDRPLRIKAELLPFDGESVEPLLSELQANGLIVRYKKNGASYIEIPGFTRHQAPHYSEKASVIPPKDSGSCNAIKEGENGKTPFLTPPDSLNPYSLNPEKDIVGMNPNGAASEVLNFLNEKTGRAYEPVKANLQLIQARLREGASVADLRAVIAMKCREWKGDPKMEKFLRPLTLFRASNFAQYKGELINVEADHAAH